MTDSGTGPVAGPLRAGAAGLAAVDALPTAVRAVVGNYAETGTFDPAALSLKRRVDARMDEILREAHGRVEDALEAEFDRESVSFRYDTKLTMPVELTLGYVYSRATAAAPPGVDAVDGTRRTDALSRLRRRRYDGPDAEAVVADVQRAESVTTLVVEALLDGDMRDAINDEEFGDFEVDFPVAGPDQRRRVAEVAQSTLQTAVERRFDAFPDAVSEAYDEAVAVSEAHQDRDERFRALMAAAVGEPERVAGETGEGSERGTVADVTDADDARERLRETYKHAEFAEPPALFTDEELTLPYLKTQYGRVGVIYEGMVEMFRAAGVDVERAFERAVVLAIVGAQLWLDDVDDFAADMEEGQLTPVTAEYVLAEDDRTAYRNVVELTERYLDRARTAAVASDSTMTGIGVEYIYRAGEPERLPGSDG
ncbi:MAG: hypothetical protein ABEJ79_06430 [Halolamina sp.]